MDFWNQGDVAHDAEDDDEDGQGDHEEYEPYELEFEVMHSSI